MNGTLKVNTTQFNSMVRSLARKADQPEDDVLRQEVAKVLESAVKFTPAAKANAIKKRSENATFSMQPASLYSPKRKRRGVTQSKNGFIAYYLKNRYPNALWSAISTRRKASLAAKLRAVGLSKQSWLLLANELGLSIKVPAYVTRAQASTGKSYSNVNAHVSRTRGKLQIAIANSQPTVNLPRVGGARALQRAIDGRVKFFLKNIEHDVFKDMAQIARAYPAMKIAA